MNRAQRRKQKKHMTHSYHAERPAPPPIPFHCASTDCKNPATLMPVLSFVAQGANHETGARAKLELRIGVCKQHADDEHVRDIPPEGRDMIEQALAAGGRAAPDWDSLQVEYVELPRESSVH